MITDIKSELFLFGQSHTGQEKADAECEGAFFSG